MKTKDRKPKLESVDPGFGHSFQVLKYNTKDKNDVGWHCHPEYEIVYISNGKGKRKIGNHFSYFTDGDLILLGPHLPHMGFKPKDGGNHTEIIVRMRGDFLGSTFLDKPELQPIKNLLEKSRKGLSFYGATKEKVGQKLKSLHKKEGLQSVVSLLLLLEELAVSDECELLNADGLTFEVNSVDLDRMKRIYQFVEENYQNPFSLEKIAKEVGMTVPAFCRFFKKSAKKTFVQFVNEFKVAKACELLANDHQTIAVIAFDCGFNNLSHFNNQFKLITGKSPSDFRKEMSQLLG